MVVGSAVAAISLASFVLPGFRSGPPFEIALGSLAAGTLAVLAGVVRALKAPLGAELAPSIQNDVRVESRHGCSRDWGRISGEDEPTEGDVVEYFVTLALPDGRRGEFECERDTFLACETGRIGQAEFKGEMLYRFLPKEAASLDR